MGKRHIVQVSAYYPPHLGGQEVVVQQLAAHLAVMGEDVEVVTSDLGARTGTTIENGVRVSRLRSAELGHTAVVWGLLLWLLKRTRRNTVVHLHAGQAFTPEVVWLAAKLRRFKYVMHMHIDPVPSGAMGKLLPIYKRVLLKRAVRGAHVVVVLNENHRGVIRSEYGYKGKLLVMSNGIEEDFFSVVREPLDSGPLELLFVGRLSPQKNLPALLEAVNGSEHKVTLDIVGDGECREQLESIITRQGTANVRLHGALDHDAVRKLYATHSALILPSLYEAQPVVLLEAMASRIPVITTAVAGIEDLARGCAILVEPTPQGIAEGIRSLAEMPVAAQDAMVGAALARVRALSWNSLIKSYIDLYDAVSA